MIVSAFQAFAAGQPLPGELENAVASGDAALVKDFLNQGADCNEEDDKGRNMLWLASSLGFVEVAQVLIEAGAHVNEVCPGGLTPLMAAIVVGDCIETMTVLIEAGADVNAPSGSLGLTPIMHAVTQVNREMIQLLLDNGGDPLLCTDKGWTAEEMANTYNHTEIAGFLKEVVETKRRHLASKAASSLNQQLMLAKACTYTIKRRMQP